MPSILRALARRNADTGDAVETVSDSPKTPEATSTSIKTPSTKGAAAVEAELKTFSELHRWDPNLDDEKRAAIEAAIQKGDVEAEIQLEREIEDQSPYPEVAASVPNTDDTEIPVSTIRVWVIGMVMATIGAGMNTLFSLRVPQISVDSLIAQLISYPIGLGWAKVFPNREYNVLGVRFNLNPGPFSVKEHALIVIMANVSYGVAYSTDTIEALRGFYKRDLGWGFNLLFTILSQVIGYGMAGSFRRFLVYPAAMVYPGSLPGIALFYTLHRQGLDRPDPAETNGWSIGRYRWFLYLSAASFVYYWIPGYLFQALSVFAFVTWIKPNNVVVNQIFGGNTGLGLIPITFDWTVVSSWVGSPLIYPFHTIVNTMIAIFVFVIVTSLGIHYTGAWYSDYLPMCDSNAYDNTGGEYNVSRLLTPDYNFDEAKYKAYSPLFLSTTFGLAYGLSFAGIISTIVHTALYHWKEIKYRFRVASDQEDDVHMRLMKKYEEVPDWWFFALFIAMFAMGFGVILGYPTELAWWAYILAMLIAAVWMVPIGMIYAITNVGIGLNVFTEFIIGYMQPGKPLAMMCFKTLGYITMAQGQSYAADLKVGHYMKIPPKSMFWAQGIATLWSCIVQVAVLDWSFNNIDNICASHQKNKFTCPNGRVFFNASIIWGAIGPARMFSGDGIYSSLQWYWLIGAALPVVFYLLTRRFPKSVFRYLNAPVMFGSIAYIPPATPYVFFCWGILGVFFQRYIYRKYRGWWMSYTYITSCALDAGLAFATIVIFFALTMPEIDPPNWWGNTVINTLDYQGTAIRKTVAEGETFGPATWS